MNSGPKWCIVNGNKYSVADINYDSTTRTPLFTSRVAPNVTKGPHMRSCVGIGHSQTECSPLHHSEVRTYAGVNINSMGYKRYFSVKYNPQKFCIIHQWNRRFDQKQVWIYMETSFLADMHIQLSLLLII